MSQALHLYLHLKSTMSNSIIPEGLQALYYALLEEGCKVKQCRKKWFRKHWIIQVWHTDHWMCYEEFHLTPNKTWWEYWY